MVDLRGISQIASLGDIVFGLVAMFVAMIAANAAIVPALVARDARAATAVLAVALLGIVAVLVILTLQPAKIFLAILVYIVVFTLVALGAGAPVMGWKRAMARVLGGSACMIIALAVAVFVVRFPR